MPADSDSDLVQGANAPGQLPQADASNGETATQEATKPGDSSSSTAEVLVKVKHAVQGGADALVDMSKHELIKIVTDVVLKDLSECYDEAIAVSGQKLSYSINLDLSFNSDARPVFAAMSARKTSGTGEEDPLPSGPAARQRQQQQQQLQLQEQNTQRATVAGIPVENFDRMHRGAVHRPEVGTAERPSCSNLQPWLQTPRSWGLRYEVDLQHDVGAMINYVPGNDVASLRGHTMIPRGTDASWHIKLSRLGKKYTTRVGVVNTNLRVRDDWYRARSPPGAWFINTSGDMYEDINKRGNTGKALVQGDVLGVHLLWSFDGKGLLRFTVNNRSLPGEIRGVEAPCHLAVQLLNKGDTVSLETEELRAAGGDYQTAPTPPPWTGHVPGSGSKLGSSRGSRPTSAAASPRKALDETALLRKELSAVVAQKEALMSLLRDNVTDNAIRSSSKSRPVSSAKRPTSSKRDDNDGQESYRGPLLAAEDSGSLAASQELSTSMEQEWACPPDRFFAEHRDRLLVPHRYGRPDAGDEIMADRSTIFGGGWVPGVALQGQRVSRMQTWSSRRSSQGSMSERNNRPGSAVTLSYHVRHSKDGDEVGNAMLDLVKAGGIGAGAYVPSDYSPSPHSRPSPSPRNRMSEPRRMTSQRPASRPGSVRIGNSKAGKIDKDVMAAAKMGDAEECNVLLAMVEATRERERLGSLALCIASSEGHSEASASLADMWGGGGTLLGGALMAAAQAGHWPVCKSLLDRSCPVDDKGYTEEYGGATPLIAAASHNRMDVVKGLLSSKANVNAVDSDGYSALMWACFKGHSKVASHLLDSGADVSLSSRQGNTALIYTAYAANEGLVLKLLEKGANPRHVNEKGLRATDVASQQGHHDLASLLEPTG